MARFQKGWKGGPGRPKLAVRIVLPEALAANGCDVAKKVAEAISAENFRAIKGYEPIMPYCFVRLTAEEIEIKPPTPEASKDNAEKMQKEIIDAERRAKPRSDEIGVAGRQTPLQVQGNPMEIQRGMGESAEGQSQVRTEINQAGTQEQLASTDGIHEVHQDEGPREGFCSPSGNGS